MATELSTCESPTLAEGMDSAFSDTSPVDANTMSLWLFSLDSRNPRTRTVTFDLDGYPTLLEELCPALSLAGFEVGDTTPEKRYRSGRART